MTVPLIKKKAFGVSTGDASLAGVSGLLLTASFPKLGWEFLAWIAFLPLFHAMRAKSPQVGFKIGFLAGLVHYVTLLYWIAGVMETYGQLPMVVSWGILFLLVIYLSLYPAAFALLVTYLQTRSGAYLWSAPVLWVALEYMRAFLLSGFPWENLGYSQYSQLHLIQISDILGVYGLSALIVAVNAAIYELWGAIRQGHACFWKPILAVALAVAAFLWYGTWRMSEVGNIAKTAPKRTVALAQGNIDQTKKWLPSFQGETVHRYGKLSLAALPSGPDLIVWPETALPFYFLHDEALTRQVVELVRACKVHFLVGSPSFRTCGQEMYWHNSAYLLNPAGEVLGKYDKVHLVPYGEYIPLKKFFPFIGKLVKTVGDFRPGDKGRLLSLEREKLGVLICFEVIFPELARAMCQNGAQLLVNITNDAWFGTSSAPYQHLSMAVFRAVENHIALARAANTGISAFIDPVGRILDSTPLFEEAVRARPLPVMGQKTFYARFGDLFAAGCILVSLVMCVWASRHALFGNRS
ncbi:MAG: apolipoprotein N-acyltransferase [Thermodesulfobacteriota bacterium]|nr:apolipoprotein N-acyltransferase [Thermodesulfobacteriota bacterium]